MKIMSKPITKIQKYEEKKMKISHMIIYIIDIQHTTWYTVKKQTKAQHYYT